MSVNGQCPALSVAGFGVRDRSRGRMIVEAVSFEVARGEIVTLVGPSGSGKSTTVLGVLGLLRHPLEVANGTGMLDGVPVEFKDASTIAGLRGRRAAMIFQDPFASLNPVLRCGAQAEEPLRIHTGLGGRERRTRILDLFTEVGLDDPRRIYESLPSELSGGQLQRVMIAMAVALGPALLIADEPTTALDSVTERTVIGLLDRLRQERGMAVVLITHDVELAASVADRVLAMQDGRLLPWEEPARGRDAESAGGTRVSPPEPDGAGYLISARSLTKNFGRRDARRGHIRGIEDISLGIHRGEVLGVVGPSGSGKTTLGRCLAGLERLDSGRILFDGSAVSDRRRIGSISPVQVIYQSPYASLNPVMSVGDAVEEGLRSLGMRRQERFERAVELLEKVGLPRDFHGRLPEELSGGERQRVVVARALAADPRVLVADEPTASLDEGAGAMVLDLLAALARNLGLGILLISHDRRTIAKFADRVVGIEHGRIRSGVKRAHGHPPVAKR